MPGADVDSNHGFEASPSNGTLAGFTGLFCLKPADSIEGPMTANGEGKTVKSDPLSKACQELLKKLEDQ